MAIVDTDVQWLDHEPSAADEVEHCIGESWAADALEGLTRVGVADITSVAAWVLPGGVSETAIDKIECVVRIINR